MRIRAKLTGLDAVLRVVGDLEPRVVRPAVRKGLADAGKLMLASAKANLRANRSVETRTLLRSMGRRVVTYRGGRGVAVIVGPRVDTRKGPRGGKGRAFSRLVTRPGSRTAKLAVPAWYAHLVEFGTRPHSVARGAKLESGKGRRPLRQVAPFHPGARPKPFLRPAFEAHKGSVLALVRARLREALTKKLAG